MRFTARFKRLTLWNKVAFIGSLASIISLPLSVILFVLGQRVLIDNATPSKKDFTAKESERSPSLTEKEMIFKAVISLLTLKTQLASEDVTYLNGLLSQLSFEDIQGLIEKVPQQSNRRSVESLLQSHQLIATRRVSGLTWNNSPVAVRFFESTDPTLDFSKIGLYADEGNPYREVAKSLDLGLPDAVTIDACETHLQSIRRLELLILRQPGT
jgi:hypothetical protein